MKRSVFNVAMPAVVVVMVAFLSAVFFTSPYSADAATAKKKVPEVARITAAEHAESRIKLLEDALQLTAAQKDSWNNVTLIMRENAKAMDALRKERADVKDTLNAVDRLKFHSQISEVQLEQLKKLIPAFETLYVSMSIEQKSQADAIMQTGKHRKNKVK